MSAAPDKPKRTPPTSYRLGAEREVRFNAYRAREKLTFSDALHSLVDAGLAAAGYPRANGNADVRKADSEPLRAPRAPIGSRLKKDPKAKERWRV